MEAHFHLFSDLRDLFKCYKMPKTRTWSLSKFKQIASKRCQYTQCCADCLNIIIVFVWLHHVNLLLQTTTKVAAPVSRGRSASTSLPQSSVDLVEDQPRQSDQSLLKVWHRQGWHALHWRLLHWNENDGRKCVVVPQWTYSTRWISVVQVQHIYNW